jgi:hypothetical protein
LLIDNPLNVATPLPTITAPPPVSVPLPGLLPIAKLTVVLLSDVTTLLFASSTRTVTAGVIAPPAAVVLGCTLNAR